MDLYRLLDLLQSSELHLTRADQMEDRWEGAFSAVNLAMRPRLYGENWDVMSSHMPVIYQHGRTHTYLHCWYMGLNESYAMWKLYDVAGKGVAVRTTAGRLKQSLLGTRQILVHGAQVQYVNYDESFIPEGNVFYPFVHKRLSFAHESEYRLLAIWSPKVLEVDEHKTAVRSEPDLPPLHIREPVDLDLLIESVYVSPDSPDWMAKVVRDVAGKYCRDVEVRHSDLRADPVY